MYILTLIKEKTLLFVKNFCETHNYDINSIRVTQPLVSNVLAENLDEKSYEIFKHLYGLTHLDELKSVLEAAYFLDFPALRDCCFCAMAVDFYIGNTEEELEKFKAKNGIGELTPEEEM